MPQPLSQPVPQQAVSPPTYRVADMHTAGEPVRIILSGHPPPQGSTILRKRADAAARFDHIRRTLMHEPRGHADMYGALLVEPSTPGADLAVLFMHHSGYSTMCGHATIALGRWAVENGLVPATPPVTRFNLECPCGVVAVEVDTTPDGATAETRFESVPAYAEALDLTVDIPGHGPTTLDIGFGGAFYAILPAARLGLDLVHTPIDALRTAAIATTEAVRHTHRFQDPDLGFLYGTILTDGRAPETANLCVFGEGQIDRSPTGSGVTARLAVAHARGDAHPGQLWHIGGPSGGVFTGEVLRQAGPGAVIIRVGGRAHHAGRAEFILEPHDPLRGGMERLGFSQGAQAWT